jgi:hypothetical protein
VVSQLHITCSTGCVGSRSYAVQSAAAVLTNRLSSALTLLDDFKVQLAGSSHVALYSMESFFIISE